MPRGSGKKKDIVEDVVFTFNEEGKIDNVSFGLGNNLENNILSNKGEWKNDTREVLVGFLENYKTAYCLKRLDYIKSIFDDKAVIIVGNVTKPRTVFQESNLPVMTNEGQDIIRHTKYTKEKYIKNLDSSFRKNEFINLRFSTCDVQWLNKYKDKERFGIQMKQGYTSSTYSDEGYLFLMVDMTDHDKPTILVRTWQPNEMSKDKVYNAGNFYKD